MHLQTLYEDLWAQEKLFDETLPEEVKYWFEYTGPLQVSCARIECLCWPISICCLPPGKDESYFIKSIVQRKYKVILCLTTTIITNDIHRIQNSFEIWLKKILFSFMILCSLSSVAFLSIILAEILLLLFTIPWQG